MGPRWGAPHRLTAGEKRLVHWATFGVWISFRSFDFCQGPLMVDMFFLQNSDFVVSPIVS